MNMSLTLLDRRNSERTNSLHKLYNTEIREDTVILEKPAVDFFQRPRNLIQIAYQTQNTLRIHKCPIFTLNTTTLTYINVERNY